MVRIRFVVAIPVGCGMSRALVVMKFPLRKRFMSGLVVVVGMAVVVVVVASGCGILCGLATILVFVWLSSMDGLLTTRACVFGFGTIVGFRFNGMAFAFIGMLFFDNIAVSSLSATQKNSDTPCFIHSSPKLHGFTAHGSMFF
jgi:hypothetical protein